MAKEEKRIITILFEGLKIYTLNLHKFLLYMAFPVLGQLLGIFIVFGLNYWFTQNLHDLTTKYSNNISVIILLIILSTLPGLIIFMKAFWDYLVAYGALNSMTEGYINTGKVYDFKSHNEVVLNKTFSFIGLWFLFGIFTLLAIIPIFWVIGFIFFVYFVLVFQVFTFENGLSPLGYFRRSLQIVKGHFARTFILMSILTILTYFLISSGVSVIFDYFNLTSQITKCLEAWAFTLPIEPVEKYGVTPALISSGLLKNIIMFVSVGFTLPLRSICWTLWYNNLSSENNNQDTKKVSKNSKKNSKTFKIEKREIDPEIIRRARLEDDEY